MGDTTELALINELSDVAVTKELIATEDFSNKYAMLLDYIDKLTSLKSAVDSAIKDIAKDNYLDTGDSSIVSSGYKYTYIPEGTRETLNTKALKADHPELYKDYVKISNVAPSLRVTKVEKKDA